MTFARPSHRSSYLVALALTAATGCQIDMKLGELDDPSSSSDGTGSATSTTTDPGHSSVNEDTSAGSATSMGPLTSGDTETTAAPDETTEHALVLAQRRRPEIGAVTFVQRCDWSLRLNVHFHTLALDGVYVQGQGGVLQFQRLPDPTHEEVVQVATWVHERPSPGLRSRRSASRAATDSRVPCEPRARRLEPSKAEQGMRPRREPTEALEPGSRRGCLGPTGGKRFEELRRPPGPRRPAVKAHRTLVSPREPCARPGNHGGTTMASRARWMLSAVLSAACTTGANVDGTSAWDPSGAPQDGDTGTTTEAESSGGPATGSGTTEAPVPHGETDTSTGSAEPTTTGETQVCAFVRVVGLGGDPLNVRSEPHTDGAIVGMLSDGHVVEVLDEVLGDEIVDPALGATDRWYEIEGAGVQGFVTALYTECTEEPEVLQWVWPTPETHTIGQDYGNPIAYQSCGFHTGLDLGGALGDPVLAVADGVVVHVGPMWFSGAGQGRGPNAIIVQHGDGPLYSTYGHNDAALVAEGEVVSAGELIAELGTLGYSSGPHLHFEILEGTPFTGDWEIPFNDACAHYRDPKDYVEP